MVWIPPRDNGFRGPPPRERSPDRRSPRGRSPDRRPPPRGPSPGRFQRGNPPRGPGPKTGYDPRFDVPPSGALPPREDDRFRGPPRDNRGPHNSSERVCGPLSLLGLLIHVSGPLPALRGPLRASALLGFLIITIALLAHDLLVFRFFLVHRNNIRNTVD